MKIIGVADTTFARFDMGASAIDELNSMGTGFRILRYTVPGIKDLPVASSILFSRGCDIVIACGMPGPKPVDKASAQVASTGLMQVQLILRHFYPEDLSEIKRLENLAFTVGPYSRRMLRKIFSSPGAFNVIAEEEKRIMGHAVAMPMEQGVFDIESIAVHPDGLYRKLL